MILDCIMNEFLLRIIYYLRTPGMEYPHMHTHAGMPAAFGWSPPSTIFQLAKPERCASLK